MKRFIPACFAILVLLAGCVRPVAVYYPPPRHDRGLHKGWYKYGKVKRLPPGQAKKMNRRWY
jgi:hypothetical protein